MKSVNAIYALTVIAILAGIALYLDYLPKSLFLHTPTETSSKSPEHSSSSPSATIQSLPEIIFEETGPTIKRLLEDQYESAYSNFHPQGLSSAQCAERISSSPFYLDPNSQAIKIEQDIRNGGNTKDADKLRQVSCTPQAIWLLGNDISRVENTVENSLATAHATKKIPVFVIYNIPDHTTLTWWSGLQSEVDYLTWIEDLSHLIGKNSAWIILEPDALPLSHNLTAEDRKIRLGELNSAVKVLKTYAPNTRVYIDAGHSTWKAPEIASDYLSLAGIARADGFSLNISNYQYTEDTISYGTTLSKLVGNKPFVIDTSRNGIGPGSSSDWCNKKDRALGNIPTRKTYNPLVDAFLWIKPPGESDGHCNGGPSAGKFWLEYALTLIENAPR